MDVCSQCGHQLGIGRFCTNCGHPVGATPAVPVAATPPPPPHTGSGRHVDPTHRHVGPAGWVPWVAALTVLLLLAGLGLWLLLDDTEPTTATDPVNQPAVDRSHRDSRTPEGRATLSAAPVAEPTDLARFASVAAPPAAPPNHDLDGNQVRYDAGNLVDDAPDTCWRMPGDGTGESIVFRFDGPTELQKAGLINGYAKTGREGDTTLDWYRANRRVLAVAWELDDGTRIEQQLRQTRELQSVDVPSGATTRTVRLTLLTVSEPGQGPARRDYTAISEVSLVGSPAG